MNIPDISVAVASNFSTTTAPTLTITGINSDRDYHTAYKGAYWTFTGTLSSSTPAILGWQVAETTASVPSSGMASSATFTLDVYALMVRNSLIKDMGGKGPGFSSAYD